MEAPLLKYKDDIEVLRSTALSFPPCPPLLTERKEGIGG